MGTFGTGAFSSDGALDLLDGLSELSGAERQGELDRLLTTAIENPESIMKDVYPDEIVAAAALVAISLPGGELILNSQEAAVAEELAAALLPAPGIELAVSALAALGTVAGQNGSWLRGWADTEKRSAAEQTLEEIRSVLQSAVS